MSQSDPNFTARVHAYITLANESSSTAPANGVAGSLSFAAARFNSWLLANKYSSQDEMKAERDTAIAHLTEHYRAQLIANYDEFTANHATLFGQDLSAGQIQSSRA